MLEDSQAELRRQLDGMLLEKEKAEEAAVQGVLRGEACIPGFFSGGSPYRRILESIGHAVHVCSPSAGEIFYWYLPKSNDFTGEVPERFDSFAKNDSISR